MDKIRLGRTGLEVTRTAFGVLPLQRVSMEEAVGVLRRAQEAGINFYDSARVYTDSEEKIGAAFEGMRTKVHIATKTHATDPAIMRKNLETSLRNLKSDYIDLYQFHDPKELPGAEQIGAMKTFQKEGKIRFIGLTSHSKDVAREAVLCGDYDTLQYPFSCLSDDQELALMALSRQNDVGFIAMKALAGGLMRNIAANFAYIRSLDWPVPIYGIMTMEQLEEFLALDQNPPVMSEETEVAIAQERKLLSGSFCRGCGYCLPCLAEINLPSICRLDRLMERSATDWSTPERRAEVQKVSDCTKCGACAGRCPYHLVPYEIIPGQLENYNRKMAVK